MEPLTRITIDPEVIGETPAKDLLKEFWRLEKEAEKMLEGLGKSKTFSCGLSTMVLYLMPNEASMEA